MQPAGQAQCPADEAEAASRLLLTKFDEPMEERQQQIKQLLENIPSILHVTETCDAATAAAAKPSPAELLPSDEVMLIPVWQACSCMISEYVRQHCRICKKA